MRKNLRRFGKYGLDMDDLPDPLVPKPLPFDLGVVQIRVTLETPESLG